MIEVNKYYYYFLNIIFGWWLSLLAQAIYQR